MGKPDSTSEDLLMSRLRVSEEEAQECAEFLDGEDKENVLPENNAQIPSLQEMLRQTVFHPNPVQELAEALCRLKPLFEYSARPIFKGFIEKHFNAYERAQLESFSGEVLKVVQAFGVTPSKLCDLFDEYYQPGLVRLLKDNPQLQQLFRDNLDLLQKVNQVWVNETHLGMEMVAEVMRKYPDFPIEPDCATRQANVDREKARYQESLNKERGKKRSRYEMFPEPDAKRVKQAEEQEQTLFYIGCSEDGSKRYFQKIPPDYALPFYRVKP